MADQLVDQHRPLREVPGRTHIGAIVKDRLVAGRQRRRHEAQLNERLHANGQQEIKNLVGIEKGIEQLVALVDQRAHVIAENAVKTHVFHAEFVVRTPQLGLPIGAKRQRGVTAADGMFPEVRQRLASSVHTAAENCSHRKTLCAPSNLFTNSLEQK